MIEIDGSIGGGQILRTALALSTYTQEPFRLTNIRKNRPNPGLKAQHKTCIRLYSLLSCCKYDIEGPELLFVPGKLKNKRVEIDIGTAGSITLLFQSVLFPVIMREKKVTITATGGTDVAFSPTVDYFRDIYSPMLACMAKIECKTLKRGYFPAGQGEVQVTVKPNTGEKKDLSKRGKLIRITGVSHASMQLEKSDVAQRQAQVVKQMFKDIPVNINVEYCNTSSIGSGITLRAEFEGGAYLGASNLGKKGKRAELIGDECTRTLKREIESGAVVDYHLADQLLPFTGFCFERIKTSKITDHTRTNLEVVKAFLGDKIKISGNIIK